MSSDRFAFIEYNITYFHGTSGQMAFSAMNYLLNIFPRYFELHVCVILPDANPCNSRYRGKMFLYIDHSHIEYLQYYILIVK
jgi:hypothetical protein